MNSKDKTQNEDLIIDFLQPWSTFVMKTKLPSIILEKMLNVTDRIYDNRKKTEIWNQPSISHGSKLVGQIENEFTISPQAPFDGTITSEILADKSLIEFFEGMTKIFIVQSYKQNDVHVPLNNKEKEKRINKDNWLVDINSMWSVHQKDNEYNPIHFHAECDISAVMYLKIPEYLPSRKNQQISLLYLNPSKLPHYHRAAMDYDGTINFTNSTGNVSYRWGQPTMTIHPQVGDFFIFPSTQQHLVYPFRTSDGKGERRSVSFNARFISIEDYEKIQKEGKDE